MITPTRFLVLAALAAAGCSGRTVPVSGRLVYEDGTPVRELAGGLVQAEREGGKSSARGPIDADGRFVLGTFDPGDGAEPGTLRVLVTAPGSPDPDRPPPPAIPEKYSAYETSGLTIAAERGRRNEVTLTLERARRGK